MFSLMIFQTLLNVGILNVGLKPFFISSKKMETEYLATNPKVTENMTTSFRSTKIH